jgi:hypothetical protein
MHPVLTSCEVTHHRRDPYQRHNSDYPHRFEDLDGRHG